MTGGGGSSGSGSRSHSNTPVPVEDNSNGEVIPATNIEEDTSYMMIYLMAGLKWRGEIHEAVVWHIISSNPGMSKGGKLGSNGICDLMRDGGANRIDIWEVKPYHWNFGLATAQIDRYISTDRSRYQIGGYIGGGSFIYPSVNGTNYLVEYWYESYGIILYKYTPTSLVDPQRMFRRIGTNNYAFGPAPQPVTNRQPARNWDFSPPPYTGDNSLPWFLRWIY